MPRPNTNRYTKLAGGIIRITTAGGARFLIDAEDIEIAKRHCWLRHPHGYARAGTRDAEGRQRGVLLHRLICRTTQNAPHVDHINGDPTDCRRANLRRCTRAENMRNQRMRADNRSGFKGVGLHAQTGLFRARVRAGGKVLNLGLFVSAEQAAAAAMKAREALHRGFARHA